MNRKIDDIFNDIRGLETDINVDDSTLRKMLTDFDTIRPDTRFDTQFARRLRADLLASGESQLSPYISFLRSGLFIGAVGALMAIIIVAPLTYIAAKKTYENHPEYFVKDISAGLSIKQQINNKGTNAFGTLAYKSVGLNVGNPVSSQISPKSTPGAAAGATSVGMSIAAPASTPVTEYVYTGDELKLTDKEGKVFKRVKGLAASKQLADFIQNARFNLTNLKSFTKLGLQNLQLVEDSSTGYSINVNFDEGTIYIAKKIADKKVASPLPAAQAPADDNLIFIADQFVKDHGIDTEIYGKPFVENKTYTSVENGKSTAYAYDTVAVKYPLILDGLEVYEESGNHYGLEILVDIRDKKVTAVNNLTSQVYESSQYNLETDAAKVIASATSSLGQSTAVSSTSKNVSTVKIGTPQKILMHYVTSGDSQASTSELFVPALVFPVSDSTAVKSTIIPLVRDSVAQGESVHAESDEPNALHQASTTAETTPKLRTAVDTPESPAKI
jgi:hypothetical protein